jgi:CheY-like chemotaxis protein
VTIEWDKVKPAMQIEVERIGRTRDSRALVGRQQALMLIVTEALQQLNCGWTDVTSDTEALERLRDELFALALLDIEMPDKSGGRT